MLGGGLKFVVAKSKELQTKLERGVNGASEPPIGVSSTPITAGSLPNAHANAADTPPSRIAGSGAAFLALQQQQLTRALDRHAQLLARYGI